MRKLGLLELEFAFGSFQAALGIGFGQCLAGPVEDNCDVDVETIGARLRALATPG